MIRRPLLPLLAAAAVAAPAAMPAGAHAFDVSAQAELRPPKRFPTAMPGGYKRGARIPRGHVLLRRSVAITIREGRRNVRFRCPGGRRIRTIATNEGATIGLGVSNDQLGYTRRSRIRLFVYAASTLVERGETARGRVYVLCGAR